MRFSNVAVYILLCAVLSFAQPSPATKPAGTEPSAGFSIENIDKTTDPCVDFYQYACGTWLKNTEIPADQTEWVSFTELYERNLVTLREILEKASGGDAGRSAIDQKIGDFYGACVDEKAADAKGAAPLQPYLDRVAASKDKAALMEAIAYVHLRGPNPLFNFYSSSDLHNAGEVIAYIDQGGLTLPDRDYYLKDDAKMAEMRKHLVDYATELFTMAGRTPQQAEAAA